MATEEIIAAIIDSQYVTNDPGEIDAAVRSNHGLQYINRDRARSLAICTRRAEWNLLAEAAALFVLVDGVRYRGDRVSIESPVRFELSGHSSGEAPAQGAMSQPDPQD